MIARRSEPLCSTVVFAMLVLYVVPVFAVESGEAAYAGGSVAIAQGTMGKLDTMSPTVLVFRYENGSGSGAVECLIRRSMQSSTGWQSRGIWVSWRRQARGWVRKRERKHFLLLTYTDAAGIMQVAEFEVAKRDPPALLAVLRARAPQACGPKGAHCEDQTF